MLQPDRDRNRRAEDGADVRGLMCMLLVDHLTDEPAASPHEIEALAAALGCLRQVEMVRRAGGLSADDAYKQSVKIFEGFERRVKGLRQMVRLQLV